MPLKRAKGNFFTSNRGLTGTGRHLSCSVYRHRPALSFYVYILYVFLFFKYFSFVS